MKLVIIVIIALIVYCYTVGKRALEKERAKQRKAENEKVRQRKIKQRQLSTPICPYCNVVLEDRPKRNKRCTNCKSKIMLREGKLLTEEQAERYDEKKYAAIAKTITAMNMKSLRRYQKSGVVKYVEILASSDLCEDCMKLNGKKILLKDEIKDSTIPVKNCTGGYGYCRCTYAPVV